MADPISLPCAGCGTPVEVASDTPVADVRCDRCVPAEERLWQVRHGASTVPMTRAAIRERLVTGFLHAKDDVAGVDGVFRPIAGHPDFRAFFLPGSQEYLPLGPPPSAGRSWLPIVGGLGLLVSASAAAVLWWGGSAMTVATKAPTAEAPVAPAPVPEPPPPVADGADLPSRMREIESVRLRPGGGADAVELARALVADAPEVPTGGALLAELLAIEGLAPEEQRALLESARSAMPDDPLTLRAEAAVALAAGDGLAAMAAAERCLAGGEEPACRVYLARARIALGQPEGLDALATASAAWPENTGLTADVALAFVAAGHAEARAKVEAALAASPGDSALAGALARLRLAAGEPEIAETLARELGGRASGRLRIELAAWRLAAGDVAEAGRWLDGVDVGSPALVDGDRVRLAALGAQRAWLLSRADVANPALLAEAVAASASALAVAPGDPSVVQVRVLACTAAGDHGAAHRALDRVAIDGLSGFDRARLDLAAAALALGQGRGGEAAAAVRRAKAAAPWLDEVHLWEARVAVESLAAVRALRALRSASSAMQGFADRATLRRLTLPVPVDGDLVRQRLAEAGAQTPSIQTELGLGMAALDALGGEYQRAASRLATSAGEAPNPFVLTAYARVLLAIGDHETAVTAAERARAAAPRDPGARLVLAEALVAVGRLSEAEAALGDLSRSPTAGPGPAILAARIAAAAGQLEPLDVASKAALAALPGDIEMLRLRAEGGLR